MNKLVDATDSLMLQSLEKITGTIRNAGDTERVWKLQQLMDKMQKERAYIAFCGHFSAGKSTLINRMCGHPLLPSSPIPTSANIVSIANGEPGAKVSRYKHGVDGISDRTAGAETIVEAVPIESLEAYCVNGTDIQSVEITYPIPLLGERAILLDTPGIDSTDDAHHMATESALHLADVVFYVMDYNHVQSEVNLAFTKKMKERGKPLYLIVNQIDKHKERELCFDDFKKGALQAFLNWGVQPDGVFYVTMKEPQHPYNEWNQLQWLLDQLFAQKKQLSSYSVNSSAFYLIEEHVSWIQEQNEPKKEELAEAIEEGQVQELQEIYAKKKEELAQLLALPEQLFTLLRKETAGIIENANITPAPTRERASQYLQSRKPGFKAGFFARASQTAAEQVKRLHTFQQDYAEQAHAQLDWHLRDTLKKAAELHELKSVSLTAEIESLHVEITPEWLADQVSPGAVFGNEYALNYMKQTAAEIKQMYRKQAFALTDQMVKQATHKVAEQKAGWIKDIERLEIRLSAYHQLLQLQLEEDVAKRTLRQLANWDEVNLPALPNLKEYKPAPIAVETLTEVNPLHISTMNMILQASTLPKNADACTESGETKASGLKLKDHKRRMKEKAYHLKSAVKLIEDMNALKSNVRSMLDKAERMEKHSFTIALFGAFSAGKSSFTNALLGERILPVSPNPTTAAINKIVPPLEGWPHGTARVRMKPAEAILQDVLYSLNVLGLQAEGMPAALERIKALNPTQVTAKGKPHYSFLKAVEKGWPSVSDLLGTELKITKEEFTGYVADEWKSCFVEVIELFYSNPLTDQGIVFVDTPGADSINARHTGVAFNYIKNADAILFVTYYNHAFSQADREFLLQLGRVKDSFELDKMFFIVNASDLAASAEELDGVVKHVENNLLQHGIRYPRIYPVSSHLAAEGKIEGNPLQLQQSGIIPFEEDFVRFTLEELTQITIHSADLELNRTIHVLQQWIQGAQEGEAQRTSRIAQLKQAEETARQMLSRAQYEAEKKETCKEIQELLYYVKQRTTYRFGELFNLAFNPSSFREERLDVRSAMLSAWNELLRMITFDLSQEILATTLRVENVMNKLAQKRYGEWNQALGDILQGYESGAYEAKAFVTAVITPDLQITEITERMLADSFKSAKHFFEGEGKSRLRAELETRIAKPVAFLLEQQVNDLEAEYTGQLFACLEELQKRKQYSVSEHVEGLLDALQMKVNLPELMKKQEQLKSLL